MTVDATPTGPTTTHLRGSTRCGGCAATCGRIWALVIMLSTALAGVGLTIAIPLVTRAMIDGPIADKDIGPLLPLGLLALALGILEAALIFCAPLGAVQRGARASRPPMRHDLYARLQQLPMAFHGQWQSGQLLSRVTTDLSSIRRFFGFGLLFLVINIAPARRGDARAAQHVLAARPGRRGDRRPDHRAVQPLRAAATSWSPGRCRTSRATSPRSPRRAPSASG